MWKPDQASASCMPTSCGRRVIEEVDDEQDTDGRDGDLPEQRRASDGVAASAAWAGATNAGVGRAGRTRAGRTRAGRWGRSGLLRTRWL